MKWVRPGKQMADFINMMHASGNNDQEIADTLRRVADHMERRAAGAAPVNVDTLIRTVNRVVRRYVDERGINIVELEYAPVLRRHPKVREI